MSERDFCHWLRGYLDGSNEFGPEQGRAIRARLDKVQHTPMYHITAPYPWITTNTIGGTLLNTGGGT